MPEVTVCFWITKVLCTTVGDTAADLLDENAGLGPTGATVTRKDVTQPRQAARHAA